MSAKEMREIANAVRKKFTDAYIERLQLLIASRANEGFVDLTVDNVPDNVVKNFVTQWFAEQGYKTSSLGTTYYTIHW